MRLFVLILSFFGLMFAVSTESFAHDSNTAMLDIQKTSDQSLTLHIRTPLYHLDQAVRQASPDGDKLVVGSDLYKKSIAAYLKNNVILTAYLESKPGEPEERPMTIGSTALKIGGHETSIILNLKGFDEDVTRVDIIAPLMAQNPLQQNIIRYKGSDGTTKIFLDHKNNFEGVPLILN